MAEEKPIPTIPCFGCGGTIWRQGHWFQCPDCGMLSTAFGGQYPNLGIKGERHGAEPDFKNAVNAVRCHFAIKRNDDYWVKQNEDRSFRCTRGKEGRKLFKFFDAEKMQRELGEAYVIYDINREGELL